MAALLACPFCRTLYRRGEGDTCTVCGVKLVAFERLPRSAETEREADDLEDAPARVLPEDEPLAWNDFGRGRGTLLALAALGLGLFFAPWVSLEMPEDIVRSGYDLARGRAGWLWGGATGFLVLVPLVWSRRTIRAMLGVRAIGAMLSAMTLIEACLLMLLPPRGGRLPVELHWSWGLYASAAVSIVATIVAFRFGGTLPPLAPSETEPESSKERILH
jgi:hypothetical protein